MPIIIPMELYVKSFTKVVTQFIQFLSDNRAGDPLIEQSNVTDEEEMAPEMLFEFPLR
jgi:hypothetical protein